MSDGQPPAKPYRPNRRSEAPLDGEVVYERRDLERKRASSREAMRRLRASRRQAAAQEAMAADNSAVEPVTSVDGNKDGEYGSEES